MKNIRKHGILSLVLLAVTLQAVYISGCTAGKGGRTTVNAGKSRINAGKRHTIWA